MKVLVTGATGFLGSYLVRELLEQNREVRVLARESSPWDNLEGLEVERVAGDVRDADSLKRAAAGCRSVFHAAARYTFWDANPRSYFDVNLEGTQNVLAACEAAGVERLVYTSTQGAVAGALAPNEVLDENAAFNLDATKDGYILSKHRAELEVIRAARQNRVNAVIVNPAGPVGPRDLKPTPTGFMLVKFLNGEVPLYTSGGFNLVGAPDAARGHWLAHERGRQGERYLLTGENRTIKGWLDTFAEVTGLPTVKFRAPTFAALIGAAALEFVADNITKKPPLLTKGNIRATKYYLFFDSAKAHRELDYKPTPIEGHIRDAARWFVEKGCVKEKRAKILRKNLGM